MIIKKTVSITVIFLAIITNSYNVIINQQIDNIIEITESNNPEDIFTFKQDIKWKKLELNYKLEILEAYLERQYANLLLISANKANSKFVFYLKLEIKKLEDKKQKIIEEINLLAELYLTESDFDFYDGEQVISCTIL